MSNVPHYFAKGRSGQKLGDMKLVDGLVADGLTDVYNRVHMGVCAEKCASEFQKIQKWMTEQGGGLSLEELAIGHGRFVDPPDGRREPNGTHAADLVVAV